MACSFQVAWRLGRALHCGIPGPHALPCMCGSQCCHSPLIVQGDLVSSLPATVALKFKFTKRLPKINESHDDAKLECKVLRLTLALFLSVCHQGDMWLLATPLSDCYYDLRGDGWTSVAVTCTDSRTHTHIHCRTHSFAHTYSFDDC